MITLIGHENNSAEWQCTGYDLNGTGLTLPGRQDLWLGTSRITGLIKNTSELEMGYALAIRGLLGDKAQQGALNFVAERAVGVGAACLASEAVVEGQPAPEKLAVADPYHMASHIKNMAYSLKADAVGIGKMPPYAYYSHKILKFTALVAGQAEHCTIPVTERYPYVIVLMVDQDLGAMVGPEGYEGFSAEQAKSSNYATAKMAVMLARYIRSLGYSARAHHAANSAAVMTPCIIAAGLGELSRLSGCAAHPRLGFRAKVAAVTTDLPLVPDLPLNFGLQDFCRKCRKCAEHCPTGAISLDREPVNFNGYLRWDFDMKKCTRFRTANSNGYSCGRCMKVCPLNYK